MQTHKKKRVLVVEDDADLALCLTKRLRAHGLDVASSSDALNAVTKFQDWSPDLLLLDLGLPGGSGYSVMDQLAAMFPGKRLPVIIMTGQSALDVDQIRPMSTVDTVLLKPVDNDALLGAVDKALSLQPA